MSLPAFKDTNPTWSNRAILTAGSALHLCSRRFTFDLHRFQLQGSLTMKQCRMKYHSCSWDLINRPSKTKLPQFRIHFGIQIEKLRTWHWWFHSWHKLGKNCLLFVKFPNLTKKLTNTHTSGSMLDLKTWSYCLHRSWPLRRSCKA